MTTRLDSSSEDDLAAETERGMRLGMPIGSASHNMFNASEKRSANTESSEEEEEQAQPRSRSRKRQRATSPSESDDNEPTITVVPRKRQRRAAEVKAESSDEELRCKPQPHNKRRAKKERTPEKLQVQKTSHSMRRRGARKFPTPDENDCGEEEEEEEEEEDKELRTPARSSKRRIVRRRSPSVGEEEQSPPRSTRRRLTRRPSPSDKEEEAQTESILDEEDLEDLNDGTNDRSDEEEQEELKEDLAFLKSSPPPNRGRLRSLHEKPKSKRQEALEALKRKRAGTNEPSSSATPGRRKTVVVDTDTDSGSELEIIKEEPESDPEIWEQDDVEDDEVESDRDANALDMFQEDHEDENFIDDDADNIIGEPSANDDLDEWRLALNLSRAKTKDLFPNAVEWMVMKKIHPAFDLTRDDYVIAFRKLDDEVKALAGSKYTSSSWTPDFTRALRARPDLAVNELSFGERDVMSPHCAACNRSGHPASFEMFLQGQPYDPETLEPLSADSDSDSDSESNSELSEDSEAGGKAARNFHGERILPESHRFPLGSTCKANAQVAHTLYHWRYHLYQWVKDYLKAEGHLTAEKLVKRDGWSDRKRAKAVRKIMDSMEETGQIRSLYHSYKDQVKAALEQDNEYANGWGRGGREGGGRRGFTSG
jgi:hypothetical protein